jgi:hypothetical protein
LGSGLKLKCIESERRTAFPHVTYLLQREVTHGKLTELRTRLRRRFGARSGQLKRRRTKIS